VEKGPLQNDEAAKRLPALTQSISPLLAVLVSAWAMVAHASVVGLVQPLLSVPLFDT
jgi:hypothetical protein